MSANSDQQDAHPSVQDEGLETYLPFLYGQVYLRRARALGDVLKETGLSENEFRVLVVLNARDRCRMGQLSEWTVIDRSTLSRILGQMEASGLVERIMPPSDRRAVEVHLTQKGRAAFRQASALAEVVNKKMLHDLSPTEINHLKTALQKLAANLGAEAIFSRKKE